MSEWAVYDADGNQVERFDVTGASNARINGFNLLLSNYVKQGKLCKIVGDTSEDVCWIDVIEAEYRNMDSEKEPWRPILRKLNIIGDDEWVITDAQLVMYPNVPTYAKMHGMDTAGEPMLYWCRSVPDLDGDAVYEFYNTEIPRSFGVWACKRCLAEKDADNHDGVGEVRSAPAMFHKEEVQ